MMIKKFLLLLTLVSVFVLNAQENNDVVTQPNETIVSSIQTYRSDYSFDGTVSRLLDTFQEKGMKIFSVIDHQQTAAENGLDMQPATVIIFGNPKVGTPLMKKDPIFALQLPLKVLVTKINNKVLVSFTKTKSLIKESPINYIEVENTFGKIEDLIKKTVTE